MCSRASRKRGDSALGLRFPGLHMSIGRGRRECSAGRKAAVGDAAGAGCRWTGWTAWTFPTANWQLPFDPHPPPPPRRAGENKAL